MTIPRSQLGLAIALLLAASLHFALIGDHALESPVLAFGFLVAALFQLAQASMVVVQPSRALLRSVIVLNVFLIGLYVTHVLIGLPIPAGPGSVTVIPPEKVDAYGVMTVVAEAAAVGLAYGLVFREVRPSARRPSRQVRRQQS